METLALKVALTPALIAAASLAGRRWGPSVSGWLVGLPLTSGPVVFFLALGPGPAFAAAASAGTLAGTISQVAFCLAYAWIARGHRWPVAFGAGCLGFAVSTLALQPLSLPLPLLFLAAIGALLAALRLMPSGSPALSRPERQRPRWDIPARMVVATALVLILTGVAPMLGPHLTGLLTPFPLYAATLAVFSHQLEGPSSAVTVLRGLLMGLFAFAGFFLVLAATLEPAGIAPAFAAAIAVALLLQGASFWVLRSRGE